MRLNKRVKLQMAHEAHFPLCFQIKLSFMTKHIAISLITILSGFGLMYWSGLISETTNNNWQGVAGIWVASIGGLVLVIPFIWRNIVDPILEKLD